MTSKPKEAASDPPHPRGTLLYTKEGDLDFGWVILIFCVVVGMGSFMLEGLGVMKISNAGWIWFGSFTTMSFIAGAAISRARLIAKADVSAAQARAIDAVVEVDPQAGAGLMPPLVIPPAVVEVDGVEGTEVDLLPEAEPDEPNLFTDDERGDRP